MTTLDKSPAQTAIRNNSKIIDREMSINRTLTVSEQVSSTFHAHYVNLVTGEHGIASLIAEILTDNGSVFPSNIGNTNLRQIAIAGSMFTRQIHAETEKRFSNDSLRYPLETIAAYVSVYQSPDNKHKLANLPRVGKIQLSNTEDFDRPLKLDKNGKLRKGKPRYKWFLIQ